MKFEELQEIARKRGDQLGHLLPANWVEVKGRFTVEELELIIKAVKDNYLKIQNGHSK